MSLRELAIRVLLISIVRFSTTSIIQPQRLYIVRFSPESATSLEHIPEKWRTVHPKFKAPQIEIRLMMKGYVSPDENWMFANEYKYSGKDYKYTLTMANAHSNVVNAIITSLMRIILHDRKSISGATKMTSTTNEEKIPRIENGDMEAGEKKKENSVQDNIVMPDRFIPQIESRNIIRVPTYCPEGQKKDSRGRCRIVISGFYISGFYIIGLYWGKSSWGKRSRPVLGASRCHSVRGSTSKYDILSRKDTETSAISRDTMRVELSSNQDVRIVGIVQKCIRDWINYECMDKTATYRNVLK
ncbi:hypothetical protein ALC57_05418 [Trachymyrmex cornetzi]|uniref:Uncharacterized protein n=1 Tax=Trachymyrmex cornetzi TaxID=471704 RepID=A0A195EAJ4_9HYME|nr:hypothetical protein ALC57_05418 [Trachymyrmex cornetzi]